MDVKSPLILTGPWPVRVANARVLNKNQNEGSKSGIIFHFQNKALHLFQNRVPGSPKTCSQLAENFSKTREVLELN